MNSAIGVAKDTICCVFIQLYRQIKYLRSLGNDVQKMRRRFTRLDKSKDDIVGDPQMQALQAVRNWMDEVETIGETVTRLQNNYDQHQRCLFGCCPDCWFLLTLSRNIRECIADMEELSNQARFQLGRVPPPPPTEEVPVAELVGMTPQRALSQIHQWLADHKTRIIGVYGMGGVGKTSLVKNINNSPNVKALFDVVILTTVSQNADIMSVQNAIAGRLGLSLPADNMDGRRAKLFTSLKKKKYLLILDDLWDKIDLVDQLGVGVPSSGDGCKIVLTTRDRNVCDRMDADQLYELKTLSTDEGWELFHKKAFRVDLVIPQRIEVVAKEIAAECNGLPLALNCIAAAMRSHGDDFRQWSSALQHIRTVDDTFYSVIYGHINAELFQRLRVSYDSLPEDLKPCFLDCALYQKRQIIVSYPNNFSMFPSEVATHIYNELIPMWIAEGLVRGVGDIEDLFDKGQDFVKVMRNLCVIEKFNIFPRRCLYVKVHDVLQDLAVIIGKVQRTAVFRSGRNVVNFPLEEECVGCRTISVMNSNIQSLPTNFKCDTLLSLMLSQHNRLQQIPESFLTNLPSLKVLNLSQTNIESLPSSLGSLEQLEYLNLSATEIEELPRNIGNLNCLQFLYLDSCTKLISLPLRLGELKSLKILTLMGCKKLNGLRREISQLTSLERLVMANSGIIIGEGSEEREMQMNQICLKHLRNLKGLRQLALRVKSPLAEGLLGSWIKMRYLTLDFYRTNQEDLPKDMLAMNQLEVFNLVQCNVGRLPYWIARFQNLSALLLWDCNQLSEVPELLTMPSLKLLLIRECHVLKNLWMEGGRDGGFPVLKELLLMELPSLESLVEGILEDGIMPNLKRLLVANCEKLKELPLGMEKLKRLEEIRGSKHWWDGLSWKVARDRNHFQKMYVEYVYDGEFPGS